MKIEVCNLWHQKCCIEVKKGEENICPNCQGHGGFLIGASFRSGTYRLQECILCLGEGKIDWITSINKRRKAIHAKIKHAKIKCPSNKGCKRIKRMWRQRKEKSV